jgi:hypothetical protein
MLSPPPDLQHTSRSPKRSPDPAKRKQSSTTTGQPRPHSIFVFPVSKATSETLPPRLSTTPSPSEERQPQGHTRRISISDRVLHYEAIGGKTRTPTVASKSAFVKAATNTADTGRHTRISVAHTQAPPTGPTGSSVLDNGSAGLGDPKKHHIYPNGFPRTSPIPLARISPTDPSRTAPVGYQDTAGRTPEVQNTKPPSDETSYSEQPINTASMPINEPLKSGDERSPSPERQVVSELVNRWQRMVEEADTSRGSNRRGDFAKRAGAAGGEASKGR